MIDLIMALFQTTHGGGSSGVRSGSSAGPTMGTQNSVAPLYSLLSMMTQLENGGYTPAPGAQWFYITPRAP